MKATWNDTVLAETDQTVEVEGNAYFPREALHEGFFRASETRTRCPWKGEAHYYDVIVDGKTNKDAAWYYPDPLPAADNIRDHVAFWKGVRVTEG